MRQALNLIDNWEEEDVVDPLSNDTGRRSASFDEQVIIRLVVGRQAGSLQCSNALDARLSICSSRQCPYTGHLQYRLAPDDMIATTILIQCG